MVTPRIEKALQHYRAGEIRAAEQLCETIISPHNKDRDECADALHLSGLVALDKPDYPRACSLISKALTLKPGSPAFHCNLAVALHAAGRYSEALAAARQALQLKPDYAQALCNLGMVQKSMGRSDLALEAFEEAVRLKADFPQAQTNLGNTLRESGDLEKALASYDAVIQRHPNHSDAHKNRGVTLQALGRLEEAASAFRQATDHESLGNLGAVLWQSGKLKQARIVLESVLNTTPTLAMAHYNLGLVLLTSGEFERGWREYEWRWEGSPELKNAKRHFAQPVWQGESLNDKTLFVYTEQGLGDSLQFVRYLPALSTQARAIILECPASLKRLFEDLPGIHTVIASGQTAPTFDFHVPLMSLPERSQTRMETIPARVPYLYAPSDQDIQFNPDPSRLNIGLVWAGSPTHQNDTQRSLSVDTLAPLLAIPDTKFYSLQKGQPAQQLQHTALAGQIIDLSPQLCDFANTASIVARLDLVISVDTSVAHLAGAMAVPVWTLLPRIADWRWLVDRSDSPWYPTMRLFRQSKNGEWDDVMEQLVAALSRFQRESSVIADCPP